MPFFNDPVTVRRPWILPHWTLPFPHLQYPMSPPPLPFRSAITLPQELQVIGQGHTFLIECRCTPAPYPLTDCIYGLFTHTTNAKHCLPLPWVSQRAKQHLFSVWYTVHDPVYFYGDPIPGFPVISLLCVWPWTPLSSLTFRFASVTLFARIWIILDLSAWNNRMFHTTFSTCFQNGVSVLTFIKEAIWQNVFLTWSQVTVCVNSYENNKNIF